jgi:predicted transcriptional regulator
MVEFDIVPGYSYSLTMEICLPGELEDKLSRLASMQGRESAALVVEAVERLVDYDAWFVAEVDKGLAQIEAGQTLSHEEVGRRLQNHLAAKISPA